MHPMAQTNRQTDRHRNSQTELAQWAHSLKCMKKCQKKHRKSLRKCVKSGGEIQKKVLKKCKKYGEKGGKVDCRPYLVVCLRLMANLRAQTKEVGATLRSTSKDRVQGTTLLDTQLTEILCIEQGRKNDQRRVGNSELKVGSTLRKQQCKEQGRLQAS